MMNPSEIKSAIASKLSERASQRWHNCDAQNEIVIVAQREGIEAAVALAEDLAMPLFELIDYRTDEFIRKATQAEYEASVDAAEHDGGAGVIEVDGRSCYVM